MSRLFPPFILCASLVACATSQPRDSESAVPPEGPRALRYDTVLAGTPENLLVEEHESADKACGIPAATAYFDYDSHALDAQDRTVIIMVADCMINGPLKDRSILVSGYADFTGTYDYNRTLGLERSQSVAAELVARGVSPDRIFLRSYGERGSLLPPQHSTDRKAELNLVEITEPAPERAAN